MRPLRQRCKTDELIREFVADGGKARGLVEELVGCVHTAPTESASIVRDRGEGRFPELVKAPARMIKGSPEIQTTATFSRVDGIREIEAADMTALVAKVPDGWRLLSVQKF